MARILFMSTAEKGHTNPLVGVVQHARADGHTVGWLCIPDPAPQIEALGIEVVDLARHGAPPAPPHVTGGEELARLVRTPAALRQWIKSLLLDAVPGQIGPVRQALRAWRPDVLATDPMLYQGVIAAEREGIPWVGISSSLNPVTPEHLDTELIRTARWLSGARDALFAEHGLRFGFRVCDCLSPTLTTVFSTAEYVGDLPLPPATELVGPSVPPGARGDEVDFPWERLDGRPIVYASFGSQISWQPRLFERLARAAEAIGWQMVCPAGELADTPWAADLPGAPVVVPYAPQRELLARARAFVTHGGANSVMEALVAGVPLVVSPVCNDQVAQAWFVERAGVGVTLDLYEADEGQAALAIEGVAASASVRAALDRVGASYRAADGARRVARRLGDVALRGATRVTA